MRELENRPMGCGRCGAQVNGRETQYNNGKGMVTECRWVCPRCGTLVRVHEEYNDETK